MDCEQEPEVIAIRRLIAEGEELKQQIRYNNEQVQLLATDLLRRLTDDKQPVATYLYWQIPEINSTAIAEAIGIKPHATSQYVSPMALERCTECGCDITYSSRTKAASFASMHRRDEKHGRNLTPSLCDKCRDAERAQSIHRWEEREKAVQARYDELHTMPYQEYLQTPEWQDRRLTMLKRAHFRCQVCNEQKVLHVHHRTYERRGHENYADLIVLCGECHKLYHFPEADNG